MQLPSPPGSGQLHPSTPGLRRQSGYICVFTRFLVSGNTPRANAPLGVGRGPPGAG